MALQYMGDPRQAFLSRLAQLRGGQGQFGGMDLSQIPRTTIPNMPVPGQNVPTPSLPGLSAQQPQQNDPQAFLAKLAQLMQQSGRPSGQFAGLNMNNSGMGQGRQLTNTRPNLFGTGGGQDYLGRNSALGQQPRFNYGQSTNPGGASINLASRLNTNAYRKPQNFLGS